MGFLTKFRRKIGNKKLASLLGNAIISRQLVNLRNVRSVGVLCIPSGNKELEEAVSSVQTLPASDISMIYWHEEENLVGKNLSLPSWVQELTSNDLDFYFLPKSPKLQQFIEKPFDVLIVLDEAEELPVKGLSQLSRSRCRMGVRSAAASGLYEFSIVPREAESYKMKLENMIKYSRCFPSL